MSEVMVWLLKDIIGLTNDSEDLKEFTQPVLVITVVNTRDTVCCAVNRLTSWVRYFPGTF